MPFLRPDDPASAADPPGWRQARILQGILVFVGVYQPLSLLLAWLQLGSRLDALSITLAALGTALAWLCLLAARRGALRAAAMAFVAGELLLLGGSYWYWGMVAQFHLLAMQLLLVLVAGLMLGRTALWAAVAGVAAAICVGAWHDVVALMFARSAVLGAAEHALHGIVGIVVVAAVLDASLAALRHSLALARRRSDDLARARDRLQLQMQDNERPREQPAHAQKMEAAGSLAGGVARDFSPAGPQPPRR